jgi:hypothetical protein
MLSPMRLEVDHAKTSLFLSRKANNSACSSASLLVPRQMALLGTRGYRGTFLKSPSTSMTLLNSTGASALRGRADC